MTVPTTLASRLSKLPRAKRRTLVEALTPRLTGYIPHEPTRRQQAFLLLTFREVLYGGAAGGGKSDALLMAALQYVDVPRYAALLLRRTFPQLTKADGLVPRSHEWLSNTDAKWHGEGNRWDFPSGARLEFGHLQYEKDKYNYQGPAYQYIGFDELTQFSRSMYLYLSSRLRRLEGSPVPLRLRGGSNPGGEGHDWVRERFVDIKSRESGAAFLPARLRDNPYLDRTDYAETLSRLEPYERQMLLEGDWDARPPSSIFRREWFEIVEALPAGLEERRRWDLASTAVAAGKDPDWTAGVRGGRAGGIFYVTDVRRTRADPAGVERFVSGTASEDGRGVPIVIEQEPGSAGKALIHHYVTNVLPRFAVRGKPTTGSKLSYWAPLAAQAEAGNVKLLRASWNVEFLRELEHLQRDDSHSHDDEADAASKLYQDLTTGVSWSDLYPPDEEKVDEESN